MASFRFGGSEGEERQLVDEEDLVVVRTHRRGAQDDLSQLAGSTRLAQTELDPLFGVPASGVGVYAAPKGESKRLSETIHADPEVQFAGRGLRDEFGAPVIYTENIFVKFGDEVDGSTCEKAFSELGLQVKRTLSYAGNAFFASAPEGTGQGVFDSAAALLERSDVELCHPELIREVSWNAAFPQQWHLGEREIDGVTVQSHANVESAWELSEGDGAVVAIVDNGVDIDHIELSAGGKIVAPQSLTSPRGDDPRPAARANHGTACAGVACADGGDGASGVAPKAQLMPLRLASGLGSQDEADAFVWAAEHGADVISCSWGPADGVWFKPNDPAHNAVAPLPDSTRLAIEFALTSGREGKGCVITWAAGNGNESVDNDGYASCGGVIAVAACNDESKKSAYSDFGKAVWCCFPSNHGEPSLTPGIWTTDRTGRVGYNPGDLSLGDLRGDYTNSFGGTSSACPGVAGVVALMLSSNPALKWEEVRDLLRESCDQIDASPGEYDGAGHSPNYGYGRVNARAAVEAAAQSTPGGGPEAEAAGQQA